MCPVLATKQFEISPSTQISKKRSSSSVRTRSVSCETEYTRRGSAATGSRVPDPGSRPGSSGSGGLPSVASAEEGSSNGRSKSELVKFVGRVADARDLRRAPGLVVRLDDRAVQPGIARRGLELRRHPAEKARERRVLLHPDDRIVRAGHARVGQVCGPVRQDAFV